MNESTKKQLLRRDITIKMSYLLEKREYLTDFQNIILTHFEYKYQQKQNLLKAEIGFIFTLNDLVELKERIKNLQKIEKTPDCGSFRFGICDGTKQLCDPDCIGFGNNEGVCF